MSLVTLIVRDSNGLPVRKVTCQAADIANQAGPGETVTVAGAQDLAEHVSRVRAIVATAEQYRTSPAPDALEVLTEALKAKGIDLTKADLEAATATLHARRKVRA